MNTFDPAAYGPTFAALLRDAPLNPLDPGLPDLARRPSLAALTDGAFLPNRVLKRDMADACRAGLWLRFDFLDDSHTISQEINTPAGSFWHGILHRREPDPSNAAYWFRRVGNHAMFEELAKDSQEIGLRLRDGRWNPFDFIDLCEKHRGTGGEQEMVLRRVQQREWELLFDWCFRRATGKE